MRSFILRSVVVLTILALATLASGEVNQASGFNNNLAWSSLTGDVETDSINHNLSVWSNDDGIMCWGLALNASGHYGSAVFPEPSQSGVFDLLPLHLTWSVNAPGPWYTVVEVDGGRILSQYSNFGPLEDCDGWLASIYITGIIAPEPATTVLFSIGILLGIYPNPRRFQT